MRILFPGTYDPVTNGHLDLIGRLVPLAESLVVAVAINLEKRPLFSDDERVEMLKAACRAWPTVEVRAFRGLVVDAARQVEADLIVRGIRSSAEGDRELQMAYTNRALTGIETLLLPASPGLAYVSSSLVREVARFGGDITPFVPPEVAERMYARLREQL